MQASDWSAVAAEGSTQHVAPLTMSDIIICPVNEHQSHHLVIVNVQEVLSKADDSTNQVSREELLNVPYNQIIEGSSIIAATTLVSELDGLSLSVCDNLTYPVFHD